MRIRDLGLVDLTATVRAMQEFTEQRLANTPDEIWLCEHPAVYSQGLAGEATHIADAGSIQVVQTNRGGQVTYHGPGQVVAYPLLNLRRLGYFVKEYVYRLEESIIKTVAQLDIEGHRVTGAPGVYVRSDAAQFNALLRQRPRHYLSRSDQPDFQGLAKIAALGVKVTKGCTYHGLALNVRMDLSPFQKINPCGYEGLKTVDLSTIHAAVNFDLIKQTLSQKLMNYLQA
jgi:lipoyl(octanoyl) transferase